MSHPGSPNAYNPYNPQQPAPIVMQTPPVVAVHGVRPQMIVVDHYSAKVSTWLGIFQILAGGLSILLQIIIAVLLFLTWGSGLWGGVFFILAGAFGVAAGRSKKRSLITAHLIFSIIASILAFIHLIVCSSTATWLGVYKTYFRGNYEGAYILYLLLVFLALAEGVIAIIASAISCHGLCCGPRPAVTGTFPATTMHPQVTQTAYVQTASGPQQILVVSGGTPMTVNQQTMQPMQPMPMPMTMPGPVMGHNVQGNFQAPPPYTATPKPGAPPAADTGNEYEKLNYH